MYASQSDIVDLYGAEALAATDRDGDGVLDAGAVEKALVSASAEADSYLGVRYDLPIAGTHPRLTQICVDIALYRISNSRGWVTDEVRQRYEDALAALKDYAAGKAALTLPKDPNATDTDAAGQGPRPLLSSGPERQFSREKTRGL